MLSLIDVQMDKGGVSGSLFRCIFTFDITPKAQWVFAPQTQGHLISMYDKIHYKKKKKIKKKKKV